jgi:hypothetical protein
MIHTIKSLCHIPENGSNMHILVNRFTPPERHPIPIVQEAEWAPGPVWMGAENLAPTRIQTPDLPVSEMHSASIFKAHQTMKLEALMSSKTSVTIYQLKWHIITKDLNLHKLTYF